MLLAILTLCSNPLADLHRFPSHEIATHQIRLCRDWLAWLVAVEPVLTWRDRQRVPAMREWLRDARYCWEQLATAQDQSYSDPTRLAAALALRRQLGPGRWLNAEMPARLTPIAPVMPAAD